MHARYQRGALSLLWAAVLVGAITLVAMVALMSARYERNYFADAWRRLTGSTAGQSLQQSARSVASSQSGAVRNCTVVGKVVYSNVECDASNPTSRKVELHDTQGFEAPKTPPVPATAAEASPTLQDKMIEKAVGR